MSGPGPRLEGRRQRPGSHTAISRALTPVLECPGGHASDLGPGDRSPPQDQSGSLNKGALSIFYWNQSKAKDVNH